MAISFFNFFSFFFNSNINLKLIENLSRHENREKMKKLGEIARPVGL